MTRQTEHPRAGTARTPTEDERLKASWEKRLSLEAIAADHQRTVAGIRARLEKFGLVAADDAKGTMQ